jgi:threonine/homoserine/homoserine lactone efflux protein
MVPQANFSSPREESTLGGLHKEIPVPVRLPAFVVTCWLLAMLPGAGQALMMRQTLTWGRRAAGISISGTCTGILLWSTAAASGLSAVLLANPSAYTTLRILGGVVLAYLGVSSLRAVWRGRGAPEVAIATTRRGAYLSGLATNLGNPKAGVFAISLLPQFIAPRGHVFASGVLLGLVWAVTTAAWYLLFVTLVDRGRALVSRPAVTTWLHGVTGVVLLLLGAGVALGA